jgi:hypothetical protein
MSYTLKSEQHREIVGSVNDVPYEVLFDADGFAEVEDEAVAKQLVEEVRACVYVDEDGAEYSLIPAVIEEEKKSTKSKSKKEAPAKVSEGETATEGNEP